MTDEEREHVLQLLANYENMARGVQNLINYMKAGTVVDPDTNRYKSPLQDMIDLVPVWRSYAASMRVRFMLDRRSVPRV